MHIIIVKYCNYILHFDNNVDKLVQAVLEHQNPRHDNQV